MCCGKKKDVFNPAVAVRNDTLFLLYRAQDKVGKPAGTSRIGLAASTDASILPVCSNRYYTQPTMLLNNTNGRAAAKTPAWWRQRRYLLHDHTAFDGKNARLLVATSRDLVHWVKHGPSVCQSLCGKVCKCVVKIRGHCVNIRWWQNCCC